MAATNCLMGKDCFRLYKKTFDVSLELDEIPPDVLDFLNNFAVAHGSTVPMVLGAALPLTAAMMGPNTGIRLSPCHLAPTNLYCINICAIAGGKTATHQSVIGSAIQHVEKDDPNCITWLLENYTVAGFQVIC